MTTSVKIILIAACVCLADSRLRGKIYKHVLSSLEHSRTEELNTNADPHNKVAVINNNDADHLMVPKAKTSYDADIIVFPSDDDKVYPDVNKLVNKTPGTLSINKHENDQDSTSNIGNGNEAVPVPLISKVVPATEAKEVFTNPIVSKDREEFPVNDNENIQTSTTSNKETQEIKFAIDNTVAKNENITLDNTEIEIKSNDTLNSNETVPDFSSRFGVTSNYMLVPVNNAQTYQPVQTVSNLVSNTQGAPQSYLVNYDQSNTIPLVTNIGVNTPTSPKFVSNVDTNQQYISPNSNAIVNMYATPNANPIATNNGNQIVANNVNPIMANNANYNSNLAVAQGNGNYVPINVPNTYVINGQLYAAVTVPNNVDVPSSLYFVNPQLSGYQVANHLPIYKLVTVDQAR